MGQQQQNYVGTVVSELCNKVSLKEVYMWLIKSFLPFLWDFPNLPHTRQFSSKLQAELLCVLLFKEEREKVTSGAIYGVSMCP